MTTYTEHEQRVLDQEGGRALDRIASAPAILAGSVPLKPDAPVMLPTYEDLIALGNQIVAECNARLALGNQIVAECNARLALGNQIVAECNARLVRLGEPPMSKLSTTCLRHDIVGAMIDVRHEASNYASREVLP